MKRSVSIVSMGLVILLAAVGVALEERQKPPQHAQQSEMQARALRDACLGIFPRALLKALPLADAESPQVAQAWFQGLNPQLDDRSPARILREGELEEAGEVFDEARAAFGGGFR